MPGLGFGRMRLHEQFFGVERHLGLFHATFHAAAFEYVKTLRPGWILIMGSR